MSDKSHRIKQLELELQNLQIVKKELQEEMGIKTEISSFSTTATMTDNLDNTIEETYENKLETNAKIQQMLQKMTVFRLCGLTVLKQNNEEVTLRLESTYNGRYYDHYIVQFKLYGKEWTIKAHTLPGFIPLAEIFDNNESNDVKLLVTEIQTYLDAYSCRMAQVKAVQEKYGSSVSITALASYEFVSFYFTDGPRYLIDATFILSYGLRDEVPNKVQVLSCSSRLKPSEKRRFDEVANLLKEQEISNCIEYIIDNLS